MNEREGVDYVNKQVLTAKDLSEMLGVSESKSYQLIRIMNEELKKKGFLVCRGRVSAAYAQERFFGIKTNAE